MSLAHSEVINGLATNRPTLLHTLRIVFQAWRLRRRLKSGRLMILTGVDSMAKSLIVAKTVEGRVIDYTARSWNGQRHWLVENDLPQRAFALRALHALDPDSVQCVLEDMPDRGCLIECATYEDVAALLAKLHRPFEVIEVH